MCLCVYFGFTSFILLFLFFSEFGITYLVVGTFRLANVFDSFFLLLIHLIWAAGAENVMLSNSIGMMSPYLFITA